MTDAACHSECGSPFFTILFWILLFAGIIGFILTCFIWRRVCGTLHHHRAGGVLANSTFDQGILTLYIPKSLEKDGFCFDHKNQPAFLGTIPSGAKTISFNVNDLPQGMSVIVARAINKRCNESIYLSFTDCLID